MSGDLICKPTTETA
uniref:Uncharacterized protein n=1 Tax=Anguilla anguilla TaxID=7936 RepID=A0A0E9TFB2_ANGAN